MVSRANVARSIEAIRDDAMRDVARFHELDHLGFTAMSGQAVLSKAAAAMSQDDPFLAADLQFFTQILKLAKGEMLADIAHDMRRGR